MTSRSVPSFILIKCSSHFLSIRLDRLLLLLDTGSSPSVRNTAAKQLAQLAVKSVISDVTLVEDDIKAGTSRHQIPLNDSSAWAELLSVVARVRAIRALPSHFLLIFGSR